MLSSFFSPQFIDSGTYKEIMIQEGAITPKVPPQTSYSDMLPTTPSVTEGLGTE